MRRVLLRGCRVLGRRGGGVAAGIEIGRVGEYGDMHREYDDCYLLVVCYDMIYISNVALARRPFSLYEAACAVSSPKFVHSWAYPSYLIFIRCSTTPIHIIIPIFSLWYSL
jgi:hypothetical protein